VTAASARIVAAMSPEALERLATVDNSQTRLISHWRDCLYYVILNGVNIKKSCFTEVNINIQPFVLLLYTTVNINVHIQLRDFQCTSTVHQKSVTRRIAAVSIIKLRLTE